MFDLTAAMACTVALSGLSWDGVYPEVVYENQYVGSIAQAPVSMGGYRTARYREAAAWYDPNTNTIHMFGAARWPNVLVHELVHYLQDQNGWDMTDRSVENLALYVAHLSRKECDL